MLYEFRFCAVKPNGYQLEYFTKVLNNCQTYAIIATCHRKKN